MKQVKFYREPDHSIMAVFLKDYWNDLSKDTVTCYAHIGQHSACHLDYLKECTLAKKDEYLPLMEELTSIGYKLKILNK
jgi:hypothetical protein